LRTVLTVLLVTSASTLLESTPFIFAAALLVRALRWNPRMVPYLGCGCGTGPSARSLPALAATWLTFGPFVAVARFAAAVVVDRMRIRKGPCVHHDDSPLAQLAVIAPLSVAGAAVALFGSALFTPHTPGPIAFVSSAIAAFFISPCAMGTIALAAAIRGTLPSAASGFLCVAGIVDLRTWLQSSAERCANDALAYATAAVSCALVAARGGAGMVHPNIALVLWPCTIACAILAWRYRRQSAWRWRIAPAIMFAGSILGAPAPQYHATETSLADAFAGERLDFTGLITRTGNATTLVRYAITCCRADAAPIVIRLTNPRPNVHGWMRAQGTLVQTVDGLQLRSWSLRSVTPPADPFVYR
jgi:uncharacterized protein DUF1980